MLRFYAVKHLTYADDNITPLCCVFSVHVAPGVAYDVTTHTDVPITDEFLAYAGNLFLDKARHNDTIRLLFAGSHRELTLAAIRDNPEHQLLEYNIDMTHCFYVPHAHLEWA